METCAEEEVMKEEKFPHSKKPSHRSSVGSFGISEGNITGRKKKERKKEREKPTKYTPNHNCRKKNFPAKGYNLTT